MENYWHLSGEVVRIKDIYAKDNGAAVLIRTTAKRIGEEMARICEITVTIPSDMYANLILKKYDVVDISGHFEMKVQESDINLKYKTYFVADDCKILKM